MSLTRGKVAPATDTHLVATDAADLHAAAPRVHASHAIRALFVLYYRMTKNSNDIKAPVAKKRTVETLRADECRWPYGDPLAGDFHFCGERKRDGGPYCDVHIREAFQTAKPRAVVNRPIIA